MAYSLPGSSVAPWHSRFCFDQNPLSETFQSGKALTNFHQQFHSNFLQQVLTDLSNLELQLGTCRSSNVPYLLSRWPPNSSNDCQKNNDY